MAEIPLKLVDVIGALTTTTGMLAINRIHGKTARTNAEDHRILKIDDDFSQSPILSR